MVVFFRYFLTQCHVEHHHEHETDGKCDGSEVVVLALGHFRDQFFHDDVHHGAGGEGEKVRHHRYDGFRGQNGQEGRNGLDDAEIVYRRDGFIFRNILVEVDVRGGLLVFFVVGFYSHMLTRLLCV